MRTRDGDDASSGRAVGWNARGNAREAIERRLPPGVVCCLLSLSLAGGIGVDIVSSTTV